MDGGLGRKREPYQPAKALARYVKTKDDWYRLTQLASKDHQSYQCTASAPGLFP